MKEADPYPPPPPPHPHPDLTAACHWHMHCVPDDIHCHDRQNTLVQSCYGERAKQLCTNEKAAQLLGALLGWQADGSRFGTCVCPPFSFRNCAVGSAASVNDCALGGE